MFFIFVDLRRRQKFFDGELFPNYDISQVPIQVTVKHTMYCTNTPSQVHVFPLNTHHTPCKNTILNSKYSKYNLIGMLLLRLTIETIATV